MTLGYVIAVAISILIYILADWYCNLPKMPSSGLWRNDELKITVNLSEFDQYNAAVTINNTTIHCFVGCSHLNNYMTILAGDEIEEVCKQGEILYSFECKKLSKNKWTLKEQNSRKKYVFFRTVEDG